MTPVSSSTSAPITCAEMPEVPVLRLAPTAENAVFTLYCKSKVLAPVRYGAITIVSNALISRSLTNAPEKVPPSELKSNLSGTMLPLAVETLMKPTRTPLPPTDSEVPAIVMEVVAVVLYKRYPTTASPVLRITTPPKLMDAAADGADWTYLPPAWAQLDISKR